MLRSYHQASGGESAARLRLRLLPRSPRPYFPFGFPPSLPLSFISQRRKTDRAAVPPLLLLLAAVVSSNGAARDGGRFGETVLVTGKESAEKRCTFFYERN